MATYTCAHCGDRNDTTKDGGIVMGGNTFCVKPDCIGVAMQPIGDFMRGVVFE
jgi:hypothetical protein